jgi:hypothetical protein
LGMGLRRAGAILRRKRTSSALLKFFGSRAILSLVSP